MEALKSKSMILASLPESEEGVVVGDQKRRRREWKSLKLNSELKRKKKKKQRECVLCCVLLSSLISHHFFVSCDWCGGGVSFLWLLTLSAVLTHTKRLTIDDWHVAFYPMSFSQPKKCCYFNSSQSHMFSVQWLTLYVIGSRRIINSLMLSIYVFIFNFNYNISN